MASINKNNTGGYECYKLVDASNGRRLQYAVKLEKFSAKQWLSAHENVMRSISPEDRRDLTNKQAKELVSAWLVATKDTKANAKAAGIDIGSIETKAEMNIKKVIEGYLFDFCRPEVSSQTAIERAIRQCGILLRFFAENRISLYSQLRREIILKYPEWRGKAAADTVNQDLRRLACVIRHGVKFCGWQERYLLDGIRVKATPENTKAIRPFEIPEVKAILAWLWQNAEKTGNWYLHDMALLSVCTGMEAKALTLLRPEWFKLDLGILRVYDKLVSGVINAKTQNRARDVPLTPTVRKIFERGHVFRRKCKFANAHTAIHSYSRRAFAACETDTGVIGVNWHRFRHTCATARLSAGWQLVRVSRMLGHSNVNTTASHYAEYDLSASPAGFEGMVKVYVAFAEWLDNGYFALQVKPIRNSAPM